MGCDGGTIPRRCELVKTKPKEEKTDLKQIDVAKWHNCALSKVPLSEPIVGCFLGKLYNKDAILEFLLDPSVYGDADSICLHIQSLKDVVELKMEVNSTFYKQASIVSTDKSLVDQVSKFVCPITKKEMNGSYKYFFILLVDFVF